MKRIGLVIAVLLATTACVGPSRTDADYTLKVANSAEAMLSKVESARLAARLLLEGRAPAPFVSLRLSESEEDASSVVRSLSSVQPPSASADRLRTKALRAIHQASEFLSELRIAAYRKDTAAVADLIPRSDEIIAALRDLTEIAAT